ncbi:MAG: DUF11 domain-containing protein, partial [bacterium]|nr:DUF11 domain-containing protein [bacterium]
GGSCTVSVDTTASVAGTYFNVSDNLFKDGADTDVNATDDLTVTGPAADRPAFSKSFSPDSVFLGGRSTLTFTIDNSANGSLASELNFTDTMPTDMVVASPSNAASDCVAGSFIGGSLTAVPGSSVITLSGFGIGSWAVAAGSSCTVTVDVIGGAVGVLENVSGELFSSDQFGNNPVSSGNASASLTVSVGQIALTKEFTDDPVAPGDTVTLEFTITNLDRDFGATDIAFTDDLSAVVSGLTATGLPIAACGGTLSGTSTLTLTGGTLGPEESCTFSVTLQVPAGAPAGAFLNTTSSVTGFVGENSAGGNPASDELFIEASPRLVKEFLDADTLAADPVVAAGDDVVMRFTITNTDTASAASDIAFIDDLTAFLPFPISAVLPGSACGGSVSLISLGTERQALSLTGGSLAAGASCSFDVTLTIFAGQAAGVYVNTTEEITATIGGETLTGNPASDDFTVVTAPELTKTFDGAVVAGDSVILEFELEHDIDSIADATGIAFTDDLTATLAGLIYNGPTLTGICGPGSQLTGTTNLSFTGGSLAPGEICTFSITLDVPATADAGTYLNITSNVVAQVAGEDVTQNPASDVLEVTGLLFTKEFTDDPVNAGDTVTLEFVLNNTSLVSDVTDITFTDDLDETLDGLVVVPPATAGTCDGTISLQSGNSVLVYAFGSLTAGTSCSFSVTLQVPSDAAAGDYVNTTTGITGLSAGEPFSLPGAEDTLTVAQQVSIAKEFIDDPVSPGEDVTLRFTIDNLDTVNAASAIAFTDDLEAALTGLVATGLPAAGTACNGGTITGSSLLSFTGGSLAAGGSCTIDVVLTVPATAPLGTIATNTTSEVTATIAGLTVNGPPATDDLQLDFLSFSKSFDDPTVAGTSVTLTFNIQNLSATDILSQISFEDDLDAALSGLAATSLPADGFCGVESSITGTSTIIATGIEVLPGGSCTIVVTLLVPADAAPGDYLNTTGDLLVLGASGAQPATDTLTVTAEADLGISKADSQDPVLAGTSFSYTVTVDNAGPSDAQNVVVTDTLPAGVTLVSTTGCTEDPNGVPTCSLGTVAAGDSAAYTITVAADTDAGGLVTNNASVASDTPDPSEENNFTSEDTTIEEAPDGADLSITKDANKDEVKPGKKLKYTIVVTNNGPADATNVVATDVLPDGVTFLSTNGCLNDPTGVPDCELGTIATGESKSYKIKVRVDECDDDSDSGDSDSGDSDSGSDRGGDSDSGGDSGSDSGDSDSGGDSGSDSGGDSGSDSGDSDSGGDSGSDSGDSDSGDDDSDSGDSDSGSDSGDSDSDSGNCPDSIVNTVTVTSDTPDSNPDNNSATEETAVRSSSSRVSWWWWRSWGTEAPASELDGPVTSPEECREARVEVTELYVGFSAEVQDLPGDAVPGDVTHPGSYLLVAAGKDRDLSTGQCGVVAGDDLAVEIASVTYDAESRTARLDLAGERPLGDSLHRLIVCGTGAAPIRDLAGEALDGDLDGTPGGDYVSDYRVESGNRFTDGHFDCNIDRWTGVGNIPEEVGYSLEDTDDSLASGSAQLTKLTRSRDQLSIGQCVSVSIGDGCGLSARLRLDAASGTRVRVAEVCQFFAEPECDGAALRTLTVARTRARDTAGEWLTLEGAFWVPKGAASALCSVDLRSANGDSFDAFVDELYLECAPDKADDAPEAGEASSKP